MTLEVLQTNITKMKETSPFKKNRRGKRSGQKRRVRNMRGLTSSGRQMYRDTITDSSELSEQISLLDKENLFGFTQFNPANAPVNSTQYIIDQHERRQADDIALALSSRPDTCQKKTYATCFGLDDDYALPDSVFCYSSPVDFYSSFEVKDDPEAFEQDTEDSSVFTDSVDVSTSLQLPKPDSETDRSGEPNRDRQYEVYDSDSSVDEMFDFMSDEFERLYDDTMAESLRKLSEQELVLRAQELRDKLSCLELQLNGRSDLGMTE